jgi:hypothetical protein
MLALDQVTTAIPNNVQNTPALARQSVQQSSIGSSVDGNAVARGEENEAAQDSFTFSDDARRLAGEEQAPRNSAPANPQQTTAAQQQNQSVDAETEEGKEAEDEAREEAADATKPRGADGTALSEGEIQQIEQLKDRDLEVRAHELAHLAAAGSLANGGPKYDYQTGPDGKRYAVGGSVSIDNAPVSGDPQATIQKMTRVKAAALAPAEPSNQDRKVAADADRKKATAQQELTQQQLEETRETIQPRETSQPEPAAETSQPSESGASNVSAAAAADESQGNRQQGGNENNGQNQPRRFAGTYGASGAPGSLAQGLGLSIVA